MWQTNLACSLWALKVSEKIMIICTLQTTNLFLTNKVKHTMTIHCTAMVPTRMFLPSGVIHSKESMNGTIFQPKVVEKVNSTLSLHHLLRPFKSNHIQYVLLWSFGQEPLSPLYRNRNLSKAQMQRYRLYIHSQCPPSFPLNQVPKIILFNQQYK